MNLIVLTPVFVVAGVWISAMGAMARVTPRRPRDLPPTRHLRRAGVLDIQG